MKIRAYIIKNTGDIIIKRIKLEKDFFKYQNNTYIVDNQKLLTKNFKKVAIFKEGIKKQLNFYEIKEELKSSEITSEELNIIFRKNFLGQIKPKSTPLEIITIMICLFTVFAIFFSVFQIQKVQKNTNQLVGDWDAYIYEDLNPYIIDFLNSTISTKPGFLDICRNNLICIQ